MTSTTTSTEATRLNTCGWLSSMERIQVSEHLTRLQDRLFGRGEDFKTYVFMYGPLNERVESGPTFGTTLSEDQLAGLVDDIRSGAVTSMIGDMGVLDLTPSNRDLVADEVATAVLWTVPVS